MQYLSSELTTGTMIPIKNEVQCHTCGTVVCFQTNVVCVKPDCVNVTEAVNDSKKYLTAMQRCLNMARSVKRGAIMQSHSRE